MWVQELTLENIKCFEKIHLKLGTKDAAHKWVTLLGENGGGKSTVLQALGLLLAGPEGAPKLLTRPAGWLREENTIGKLSIKIHQGENDPGKFGGAVKERKAFGYTFFVTGREPLKIRNVTYTEPAIVENKDRIMGWVRENALTSKGKGWFAAGFGAFRRLTRRSEIIVPSLQTPERFTNFLTQFHEDEPLAALERWLVYLDYRIAKGENKQSKTQAEKQRDIGVAAINKLLPQGNRFDSITSDGRILIDVRGKKVPTLALSDGFRSILALAGDLVWRLLEAFPNSETPLEEEGVVLIDELDIHLHPTWQRDIAGWLREQFPNIQFIVATHSPMIAAGAGADAITYRLIFDGNQSNISEIKGIAFQSVDKILMGDAFSLVSPYSPQAEKKISQYLTLKRKACRTPQEENELQETLPFIEQAFAERDTNSLDYKVQELLREKLAIEAND